MRLALLLSILLFAAACPAPVEHPFPIRECATTLRFAPRASFEATDVVVNGEWNNFAGDAMAKQEDGAYTFTATLEPRDYAYAISAGGSTLLDEANPYRRFVAEDEYSLLRVGDCREPLLRLEAFSQPAPDAVTVAAQFVDGSEKPGLREGLSVRVTLDGADHSDAFDPTTGRIQLRADGLQRGKHTVRMSLSDADGPFGEELYLPFWVEDEPFDWQEALLYFAFTDRFRNGNPANDAPVPNVDPQANYAGGDWAGITLAIEEGYFDSLGVRALWISPVQANPDGSFGGTGGHLYTGYHGYWPSKAREPQRRFGTLEELKALTRAAHARGIRVITDLVINHVHAEHEHFAAHRDDGWFNTASQCVCGEHNCGWDARRLDCWFTGYLPDVNWRNPRASEQFAQDALYWVKEADLDGLRLDAVKHADHVAGRTIAGRLNEVAQATGSDFYLVGETFTGAEGRAVIAEYIGQNELDGQFDFPLYWPLIEAFARGGSFTQVDDAVKLNEATYAPGTLNSPFIGNHDVPRFISIAANQVEADSGGQAWGPNRPPAQVDFDLPFARARDALTFVLTLPGVPLIYYGDELGLPGTGDPDNRRLMRFGAELSGREEALLSHVKKVGQARLKNRGLRYGARYTLWTSADSLIYQRDDAASDDGAIITVHRAGDEVRTVALRGRLKESNGLALTDVISGRTATIANGQVSLPLPAQSAGVWIPK